MAKKIPLLLSTFFLTILSFSQEKTKTYWYTSNDAKGYITIQKIDSVHKTGISTILKTTVKATFDNEVLDFSLTTINDTHKMVSPVKIVFDGTIDATIKPVHFTGKRIKKDAKSISFWNFNGDFVDEMETDPDIQRFSYAKYNATLRIPERTIPSFNIWAIVPNLPFDRKGTFKFNALDETKLYVKKNQTINYLGKYKTTIHGNTLALHKFVHQGKGMLPIYYWVNDNRELVQVQLDNKYTFTLTSKKEALTTISQ